VSLVELAAPAGEPRLQAAASTVLDWLTGRSHRQRVQVIDGLTRRCASQEGNALAVACRLGMAGDPRAELLAHSLVAWQWPDGGWNCDPRASGRRSSFHESLPPAWGLHEYWLATGAAWAREAAARAAELLLSHRLFWSLSDGEVIDRRWLALHYPPYWHYDLLQALLILLRLGKAGDPRAGDALELLVRPPPGRWMLAAGRLLVAPARHPEGVWSGRGGRLGAVGPQRAAHPQCPAGAQGRRLSGTLPRPPAPTARRSAWAVQPVAADERADQLQEPEQDVGAPLGADPQPPIAHQPGHTPLRRIAVAAQPLARVNAAPGEVAGPSCVLSDALPYLGFAVL
jgi:hypothetical protein